MAKFYLKTTKEFNYKNFKPTLIINTYANFVLIYTVNKSIDLFLSFKFIEQMGKWQTKPQGI